MCEQCVAAACRDPEGVRVALLSWAALRGWPRLIEPFGIEGGENAWQDAVRRATPLCLGLAWGALEDQEARKDCSTETKGDVVPILKWTEPKIPEPGIYQAIISGVDQVEGEYGPQIRLRFTILTHDGEKTDEQISGYCSATWGPQTKLYQWAKAILKGKVSPGEDFDTDELLNRRCDIQVEHRQGRKGLKAVVTQVYPYRTASVDAEES